MNTLGRGWNAACATFAETLKSVQRKAVIYVPATIPIDDHLGAARFETKSFAPDEERVGYQLMMVILYVEDPCKV